MIKVTNSSKKRIFLEVTNEKNINMKNKVENYLSTIEYNIEQSSIVSVGLIAEEYNKLNTLEQEILNNNDISLFKYKNAIDQALKELELQISDNVFQKELEKLKKYLFLLLIGKFEYIKLFIKNLDDNKSLLIKYYNNLSTEKDFKVFKKSFEKLYQNELSEKTDLKKSFFKMLNLNVCPYCNRNFINPIYKKKIATGSFGTFPPDIEHFFPKSIYPFLSLSISNLLPSCTFCNKIKHSVDTYKYNFKSPYEIKDCDFSFDFEPISIKKRKINIISKDPECKNIEILNLDDLYREIHSQYINDIFFEVQKENNYYKIFLKKFNVNKPSIQDKIYKKKFRNYFDERDFNKHPLSKLTKDLFNHINNHK